MLGHGVGHVLLINSEIRRDRLRVGVTEHARDGFDWSSGSHQHAAAFLFFEHLATNPEERSLFGKAMSRYRSIE